MANGPRTPEEVDALVAQNRERFETSARVAKLAIAADVSPRSIDDDVEGRPVTPLSEAGRAKVDEWLAGVQAIREGLFDTFLIEYADGGGIRVEPENADQVEAEIRISFAPYYPEIVPAAPEA